MSKYPPLNNWDLEQDKLGFEKFVDNERARLKFLNQEEERIQDAKKVCLNNILVTRRKITEIDKKLT
ncbi:hypothetical protein vBRpoPV13_78 [Ruegeria phage vB_RpoP-V13]|jgi:hypothetical protein|uniref:Uncharacterized protein n=1 Tax=Ruegeria phage vB_RpoP-V13 TaxID=2218612 RepID=A0A2Z4QGQ6_9CAUD|nr:hypothetical protein HYP63_gp78 [Ruegeria phage vB_RpoP-V13]AWY09435.1 hypothetical protein vBRpoPV13_78 [Ruegeria phage vB_RpoP-V13]